MHRESSTPSLSILSERDQEYYRRAWELQARNLWSEADAVLAQVENPLLAGHVLARRYQDERYNTTRSEMASWLKRFADHPQAGAIARLAESKYGISNSMAAHSARKNPLAGFGDTVTRVHARDDAWISALNEWKSGHYAEAAARFDAMAQRADASDWQEAAAHFWAYRAHRSAGNSAEAARHLEQAATGSRNFYGILARSAQGESLELAKTPPAIDARARASLLAVPALARAVALKSIGQDTLAEGELRTYFPQAPAAQKQQIATLAGELDLPAAQIRMGRQLADTTGGAYDYALYPTPGWKEDTHYAVDPALVFAFARQESGFHAAAKSHMGATGVMQLMPDTANYLRRNKAILSQTFTESPVEADLHRLTEPLYNLSLGESYLHYLMQQSWIRDNLFYLAAAYNAGPGKLLEWQKTLDHANDPLLFVEMIPYPETRKYVMQVMTNYWIYRDLMGEDTGSAKAIALGDWPKYPPYEGALTTLATNRPAAPAATTTRTAENTAARR